MFVARVVVQDTLLRVAVVKELWAVEGVTYFTGLVGENMVKERLYHIDNGNFGILLKTFLFPNGKKVISCIYFGPIL